ncbi:unnamed protein product [Rhodiola kirilowii]
MVLSQQQPMTAVTHSSVTGVTTHVLIREFHSARDSRDTLTCHGCHVSLFHPRIQPSS